MMRGPRPLVVLRPVSVLIAVVGPSTVLMAADRAAVQDGPGVVRVTPGFPNVLDDRSKIVRTPAGVLLGVAGKSAAVTQSGLSVDLLDALPSALSSEPDPSVAAAVVLNVLRTHAQLFRSHAAASAAPVRSFARAVHTVVLVAGAAGGEPELYAVGLTEHGRMEMHTVHGPGVVYAPGAVQADVEQLLLDPLLDPNHPVALWRIEEHIRGAAHGSPGHVSLDWEHAVVDDGGVSEVVAHPYRSGIRPL